MQNFAGAARNSNRFSSTICYKNLTSPLLAAAHCSDCYAPNKEQRKCECAENVCRSDGKDVLNNHILAATQKATIFVPDNATQWYIEQQRARQPIQQKSAQFCCDNANWGVSIYRPPLEECLKLVTPIRCAARKLLDPTQFKRISPEFWALLKQHEDAMLQKYPLYGLPKKYICFPHERFPPCQYYAAKQIANANSKNETISAKAASVEQHSRHKDCNADACSCRKDSQLKLLQFKECICKPKQTKQDAADDDLCKAVNICAIDAVQDSNYYPYSEIKRHRKEDKKYSDLKAIVLCLNHIISNEEARGKQCASKTDAKRIRGTTSNSSVQQQGCLTFHKSRSTSKHRGNFSIYKSKQSKRRISFSSAANSSRSTSNCQCSDKKKANKKRTTSSVDSRDGGSNSRFHILQTAYKKKERTKQERFHILNQCACILNKQKRNKSTTSMQCKKGQKSCESSRQHSATSVKSAGRPNNKHKQKCSSSRSPSNVSSLKLGSRQPFSILEKGKKKRRTSSHKKCPVYSVASVKCDSSRRAARRAAGTDESSETSIHKTQKRTNTLPSRERKSAKCLLDDLCTYHVQISQKTPKQYVVPPPEMLPITTRYQKETTPTDCGKKPKFNILIPTQIDFQSRPNEKKAKIDKSKQQQDMPDCSCQTVPSKDRVKKLTKRQKKKTVGCCASSSSLTEPESAILSFCAAKRKQEKAYRTNFTLLKTNPKSYGPKTTSCSCSETSYTNNIEFPGFLKYKKKIKKSRRSRSRAKRAEEDNETAANEAALDKTESKESVTNEKAVRNSVNANTQTEEEIPRQVDVAETDAGKDNETKKKSLSGKNKNSKSESQSTEENAKADDSEQKEVENAQVQEVSPKRVGQKYFEHSGQEPANKFFATERDYQRSKAKQQRSTSKIRIKKRHSSRKRKRCRCDESENSESSSDDNATCFNFRSNRDSGSSERQRKRHVSVQRHDECERSSYNPWLSFNNQPKCKKSRSSLRKSTSFCSECKCKSGSKRKKSVKRKPVRPELYAPRVISSKSSIISRHHENCYTDSQDFSRINANYPLKYQVQCINSQIDMNMLAQARQINRRLVERSKSRCKCKPMSQHKLCHASTPDTARATTNYPRPCQMQAPTRPKKLVKTRARCTKTPSFTILQQSKEARTCSQRTAASKCACNAAKVKQSQVKSSKSTNTTCQAYKAKNRNMSRKHESCAFQETDTFEKKPSRKSLRDGQKRDLHLLSMRDQHACKYVSDLETCKRREKQMRRRLEYFATAKAKPCACRASSDSDDDNHSLRRHTGGVESTTNIFAPAHVQITQRSQEFYKDSDNTDEEYDSHKAATSKRNLGNTKHQSSKKSTACNCSEYDASGSSEDDACAFSHVGKRKAKAKPKRTKNNNAKTKYCSCIEDASDSESDFCPCSHATTKEGKGKKGSKRKCCQCEWQAEYSLGKTQYGMHKRK